MRLNFQKVKQNFENNFKKIYQLLKNVDFSAFFISKKFYLYFKSRKKMIRFFDILRFGFARFVPKIDMQTPVLSSERT